MCNENGSCKMVKIIDGKRVGETAFECEELRLARHHAKLSAYHYKRAYVGISVTEHNHRKWNHNEDLS